MNAPLPLFSLNALHSQDNAATLRHLVQQACSAIAPLWPLATFAARSPWQGLEHGQFDEVARRFAAFNRSAMYPAQQHAVAAMQNGEIDPQILHERVAAWLAEWQQTRPQDSHLSSVEAQQFLQRVLHQHRGPRQHGDHSAWASLSQVLTPLIKLPASGENVHWARARTRMSEALGKQVDLHCIATLKLYLAAPRAAWAMPQAQQGLYQAWRARLADDTALPRQLQIRLLDAPADASMALQQALRRLCAPATLSSPEALACLQAHLLALPGWAGMLLWQGRQRGDECSLLFDYLALRLSFACALQEQNPAQTTTTLAGPTLPAGQAGQSRSDSTPPDSTLASPPLLPLLLQWANHSDHGALFWSRQSHEWQRERLALAHAFDTLAQERIWLEAREWTYRRQLQHRLSHGAKIADSAEVQLVFCIDVRSGPLRHALEAAGRFATFGYAGFFGMAVRKQALDQDHAHDACPVIAKPICQIDEVAAPAQQLHYRRLRHSQQLQTTLQRKLKQDPLTSLLLPELDGPWQTLRMLWHSFVPANWRREWAKRGWGHWGQLRKPAVTPKFERPAPAEGKPLQTALAQQRAPLLPQGMTLEQQVESCAQVLRTLGLHRAFAPLVVMVGHGSRSRNNPYAAKLDCGACGGASGAFNAQLLATLCNQADVRAGLAQQGIVIPQDTVFMAAEHITSLDQLEWLMPAPDGGPAADAWRKLDAALPAVLAQVQQERLQQLPGHAASAWQRSDDWSEIRPESGLARNAAFIIGSAGFVRGRDLQGRAFLQTWDWQNDADGSQLDAIIAGPVTVGQWINLQYYASSVAPHYLGSGSKVSQSITAGLGVMQGNGSDLLAGFPWQALFADDATPWHAPQRLLVVIEAPASMVQRMLDRNPEFAQKLRHAWLHLCSHDPLLQRWQDWS